MEAERLFVYMPDSNDLVELPRHFAGLTEEEISFLTCVREPHPQQKKLTA